MFILFDIDHTLLDTEKLRNKIQNKRLPALFGISTEELKPITEQYLNSLNSSIEFSPRKYTQLLANKFDKTKCRAALRIFLNNPADFQKSLYPEISTTLQKLRKDYHLGIFSEGNLEFQKAKLKQSGIKKFFDPRLTFIFPTKANKLNFVWNKTKNYEGPVFIVDDNPAHIVSIAKTHFIPILIQRNKKREKNYFSIQKLSELLTILQSI